MPLYEVRSLDVWGNAVDGYDVNNTFHRGEVRVPPDADNKALVEALVKEGHLNRAALEELQAGGLSIDDMGEWMEITEADPVFVAVSLPSGDGGIPYHPPRFLEATTRRQAEEEIDPETEEVQEQQGMRPILHLALVEGNPDALVFLREKIDGAVVELRAEPGKTREIREGFTKMRTGREVSVIDVYVDGDFSQEVDFPEGLSEGYELGYAKSGKLIEAGPKLAEKAQVAMDVFHQGGGEGHKEFVASDESLLEPAARRVLDDIRANTDAFYANTRTHEEFGERQRKLWDKARELGVSNEIARIVSRVSGPKGFRAQMRRELQVGDHVKFAPNASHPIANIEIEIGGETGVVRIVGENEIWIELDELHPELDEWNNTLHFQTNEGHFPDLEPSPAEALASRGLRVTPCGLNADWSVEAWMLSPGTPNRVDGAYYLLDTEDGDGNFAVARRFYEELPEAHGNGSGYRSNPRYVERDQGVEEVIPDGSLTTVLDEYIRRRDQGLLDQEFIPV